MSASQNRAPYASGLTPNVIEFIAANVQRESTLASIERCVSLLEEFPAIGRVYDPEYPAARVPFPCRSFVIPDTPFTLYYLKDDEERRIVVFAFEWTAGDPVKRFSKLEESL